MSGPCDKLFVSVRPNAQTTVAASLTILEISPYSFFDTKGSEISVYREHFRSRGLSEPLKFLREFWRFSVQRRFKDVVFDLVFLESPKETFQGLALLSWSDRVFQGVLLWVIQRKFVRANTKFVVFNPDDRITVCRGAGRYLEACDLYLKRELSSDPSRSFETIRSRYLSANNLAKVYPFPICGEEPCRRTLKRNRIDFDSNLIWGKRKYDIIFIGKIDGRPGRKEITAIFDVLGKEGYSVFFCDKRLDYNEYMELLANAQLCLSPRGLGWDCYRHYEAASQGCVPILPFPDIRRSKPLLDGKHCFFYDESDSVLEQIRVFLSTETKTLVNMGKMSREHVLDHHTFEARLQEILILSGLKKS